MHKELQEQLNFKISQLSERTFQEFLNELFPLYYEENYIPIRPQHDLGNDGCLKNKERLFAIYAPETRKSSGEIRNKLESDFAKYTEHWQETYKTFTFVYNNPEPKVIDITANELKLANTLGIDFWTRGYLIEHIIEKLPFSKKGIFSEKVFKELA